MQNVQRERRRESAAKLGTCVAASVWRLRLEGCKGEFCPKQALLDKESPLACLRYIELPRVPTC